MCDTFSQQSPAQACNTGLALYEVPITNDWYHILQEMHKLLLVNIVCATVSSRPWSLNLNDVYKFYLSPRPFMRRPWISRETCGTVYGYVCLP